MGPFLSSKASSARAGKGVTDRHFATGEFSLISHLVGKALETAFKQSCSDENRAAHTASLVAGLAFLHIHVSSHKRIGIVGVGGQAVDAVSWLVWESRILLSDADTPGRGQRCLGL